MKLIKDRINNSFTRSAKTYDKYSFIQNNISDKMISLINKDEVKNILEVGTGTGNYALQLKRKYPDAELYLIDFSKNMLAEAERKLRTEKNITYLNMDAEDVDLLNKKFDIITSNSTFQWFINLENYLYKIIKFLNPSGVLLFSYFGNRTFTELNESMKTYYNRKNIDLPAQNFHNRTELIKILEGLKKRCEIKEFIKTVEYPNLFSLFKEIRGTGEYGYGVNRKVFLTRKSIKDIEAIYRDKFNKISATYHFFIITIRI